MNLTVVIAAAACAQTPGAELDMQIAGLKARIEALENNQRYAGLRVEDYMGPEDELADGLAALQTSGDCDVGCTVILAAKEYVVTKPVAICRQMVLRGQGGWGPAAATLVRSSTTVALRVAYQETCASVGLGRDGRHSVIEHVGFTTSMPWTEPTVAILMEGRAHVSHVWARNFTHGLRIDAGVGRSPGVDEAGVALGGATNANTFMVTSSRFDLNHHAGIYIDGPDANAGTLVSVDAAQNCRHGDHWSAAYGPCGNVYEGSFLGNTYVGGHAAHPTEGVHIQTEQSGNARNTFVGLYGESPHVGKQGPNDVVVGGIMNWGGGGLSLLEGRINGFCTVQDDGLGELCIGSRAGGQLLQFRGTQAPFNGSRALRLGAAVVQDDPAWLLQAQNHPTYRVGVLDARDMTWKQWSRSILPTCTSTTSCDCGLGVCSYTDGDGTSLCEP